MTTLTGIDVTPGAKTTVWLTLMKSIPAVHAAPPIAVPLDVANVTVELPVVTPVLTRLVVNVCDSSSVNVVFVK
jgi:hypothetical protein